LLRRVVVLLVKGSRVRMPGGGGVRGGEFFFGRMGGLAAALFGSVDGIVAAYGG
jgi:hypothetical protein